MPSKNVSYICNVCRKEWRDFEDADKCEKSHKILMGVDKAVYSAGDRKSDYPLSVLVHFKDNTSARYYRK